MITRPVGGKFPWAEMHHQLYSQPQVAVPEQQRYRPVLPIPQTCVPVASQAPETWVICLPCLSCPQVSSAILGPTVLHLNGEGAWQTGGSGLCGPGNLGVTVFLPTRPHCSTVTPHGEAEPTVWSGILPGASLPCPRRRVSSLAERPHWGIQVATVSAVQLVW